MDRTWRIGEVADRTGLTRRTLRHYDELGLLVPATRSNGDYRLYDEEDLLRLLQIQNLKALGLSLPEIAEALSDRGLDATTTLRSHLVRLETSVEAAHLLMDRLRKLAGTTERSWEDVLGAIAMSQALAHPDPMVRIRAALDPSTATTSELLTAMAEEADPAVREVLMWSLAQHADATEAATIGLKNKNPELRCLFVRLLVKLDAAACATSVAKLLTDPDQRVASIAVQALGQLRDPETITDLLALLVVEPVPSSAIIEALSSFGAAALDPLSQALDSAPLAARLAVIEIIGRIGGESVAEVGLQCAELVEPWIWNDAEGVRLAAVLALGEIGAMGKHGLELALAFPEVAGIARKLLLDLDVT